MKALRYLTLALLSPIWLGLGLLILVVVIPALICVQLIGLIAWGFGWYDSPFDI